MVRRNKFKELYTIGECNRMIYGACRKTLSKAKSKARKERIQQVKEFNRLSRTRVITIYVLCALLILSTIVIIKLQRQVHDSDIILSYASRCTLENDNLRAQYGLCTDKLNTCTNQITEWREHNLCFNTPPSIIGVDSVVIR